MVRSEIINLLHEIGKVFYGLSQNLAYPQLRIAITEDEYADLEHAVVNLESFNPWFTEQNTRMALGGIATWLGWDVLSNWSNEYPFTNKPRRVAIVMAGNIPLVGFHDFLCVLMSGHHAICKFSSQDAPLWHAVLKLMNTIDSRINEHFTISSGKLTGFDAVIATGSNNTSITFKHYFGKYPNIIRQSRTSVAVLEGDESDAELQALADDIFSYFGFGCRNVTQLLVPKTFDVQRLFANFMHYSSCINHHKYMNNFDYYRAICLLNKEEFLENGFIIMRFNQLLHAPPAVLNCYRYDSLAEVDDFIDSRRDEIQVVVSRNGVPFGTSQTPKINDYADGVDVMRFLSEL
jgi:hypothetical protein